MTKPRKLMGPVFYPKFSSDPLHKENFRASSPKTVVVVINIQNRPQKVTSTKIETMFFTSKLSKNKSSVLWGV